MAIGNFHKYEAVGSSDEEPRLSREELTGSVSTQKKRRNLLAWLCAISWTITFLTLSLQLWQGKDPGHFSYASGWDTELASSREAVELKRKVFTGAPAYSEDGDLVVLHQDPVKYTGTPSPEIDQAWNRLVEGRYFLISEEEAKATWGEDDYEAYWSYERGGYVAGLDVFHTLHCLNLIRMRLYPEYYNEANRPGASPNRTHHPLVHNGHCIDQIRQYIMCAGDLTVIGTKYYASVDRNYVLSDVPHVCRNFDKIREWTWDRFNGSKAVAGGVSRPKPKIPA